MRGLTVLSAGYTLAPAGRNAVGGAEQVLAMLDAGLTRRGHRSIVVGWEGSEVAGELVPVPKPPSAVIGDAARASAQHAVRDAIARTIASERVDAVHLHGLDYASVLPIPAADVPVLVTLHLPPEFYAASPQRPGVWYNAVSADQHARLGALPHLLPPVANGIAVGDFAHDGTAAREHALLLARICPEKGIHLAIEAARLADVTLLIGGEVFPYPDHIAYFEDEVRPRLDDRRRFLGPLDYRRKRELLATARCLLVPSLANETSSLVAMEAAASGTPVIAFRRGALSETVEQGRTGFVVDDVAGMAEAIGRDDRIDPVSCIATARRRFDAERMVAEYVNLYGAVIAAGARC